MFLCLLEVLLECLALGVNLPLENPLVLVARANLNTGPPGFKELFLNALELALYPSMQINPI